MCICSRCVSVRHPKTWYITSASRESSGGCRHPTSPFSLSLSLSLIYIIPAFRPRFLRRFSSATCSASFATGLRPHRHRRPQLCLRQRLRLRSLQWTPFVLRCPMPSCHARGLVRWRRPCRVAGCWTCQGSGGSASESESGLVLSCPLAAARHRTRNSAAIRNWGGERLNIGEPNCQDLPSRLQEDGPNRALNA